VTRKERTLWPTNRSNVRRRPDLAFDRSDQQHFDLSDTSAVNDGGVGRVCALNRGGFLQRREIVFEHTPSGGDTRH